jgi:hypothetical protein
LSINKYIAINDPVHLHRRNYKLLAQIYPDGTEGYLIASGVFQLNVDLPFLYPVDITNSGHTPQTGFNKYLSNYHSAHTAMFDSLRNEMLSLEGASAEFITNEDLPYTTIDILKL